MIHMQGISKRFGRRIVLDDVSFDLTRGESAALLGPNGAGKTTTLRILAGFMAATSGDARIGGWNVMTHSLEARRRIGYLPENVAFYPNLNVDEYLRFRARIKGVPGNSVNEHLNRVKELAGLQGCGSALTGFLSRGMRQRVGLADVLVNEPEVMILDEPTLGLDPSESEAIIALLESMLGKCTILLSTHQLSEAERLCKRVLLLNRGRLISTSMQEFTAHPHGIEGAYLDWRNERLQFGDDL